MVFSKLLIPFMQNDKELSSAETLSRVHKAISVCINNKEFCVKQLVTALEWSKNETVLADILKCAEDQGFSRTDWTDFIIQ